MNKTIVQMDIKIVEMNIKIDQMGKKIVQMDKKIVQMRIHHIQTSRLYETFKFLEYKKCSKYI